MNLIENIYYYTLIFPLERLYYYGVSFENSIISVGGWQGKSSEEICFHLTKVPIHVWTVQKEECQHLIQRNFRGFQVYIETFFYYFILYKLIEIFFIQIYIQIKRSNYNHLEANLHK